MFVKALRVGLGQIIIAGDFLTRPRKKQRSAEQQAQVNAAAKDLTLYQFHACPFCVKTRRTLHRLNVPVALKDAKNNEQDRQTLLEQGGKIKVPCLAGRLGRGAAGWALAVAGEPARVIKEGIPDRPSDESLARQIAGRQW